MVDLYSTLRFGVAEIDFVVGTKSMIDGTSHAQDEWNPLFEI